MSEAEAKEESTQVASLKAHRGAQRRLWKRIIEYMDEAAPPGGQSGLSCFDFEAKGYGSHQTVSGGLKPMEDADVIEVLPSTVPNYRQYRRETNRWVDKYRRVARAFSADEVIRIRALVKQCRTRMDWRCLVTESEEEDKCLRTEIASERVTIVEKIAQALGYATLKEMAEAPVVEQWNFFERCRKRRFAAFKQQRLGTCAKFVSDLSGKTYPIADVYVQHLEEGRPIDFNQIVDWYVDDCLKAGMPTADVAHFMHYYEGAALRLVSRKEADVYAYYEAKRRLASARKKANRHDDEQ